MDDYVSNQNQGALMDPSLFTDDYVSNQLWGDLMDPSLFDLDGLEMPDWTAVELDPVQDRGKSLHRSSQSLGASPVTDVVELYRGETQPYETNSNLQAFAEHSTDLVPTQVCLQVAELSTFVDQSALLSLPKQLEEIKDSVTITAPRANIYDECDLAEHHANSTPGDASVGRPPAGKVITQDRGKRRLEFTCPNIDCPYQNKFSRKYELDRHIRTKHQKDESFACPYYGCLKGVNQSTFSRSDKLTQHIREVHSRMVDRAIKCPAEECSAPPMELGLLGVHIRRYLELAAINVYNHYSKDCLAIANAASSAYINCPLWNCRKQVGLQSFPEHLITHDQAHLLGMEGDLISANYLLVRDICYCGKNSHAPGTAWGQCDCPITGVNILCPVCKAERFDNHSACQDHIDEVHLVAANHKFHFSAWRTTCLKNMLSFAKRQRLFPWRKWHVKAAARCPLCVRVEPSSHHEQMLADPEEIKPFRREILKVYPGFELHPVWNDLKVS